MHRPPVKLVGPLERLPVELLDLAQRSDAPAFFLALPTASPRLLRTEREFAALREEEVADEVGPWSGMGKTLGYSSMLNSLWAKSSSTVFKGAL